MLTLSSVSKSFGGLRVLEQIDLTIPERGIFGLIGPNGAGKTTLFNLVSGLLRPTAGTIRLAGHRLDGMAPFRIARLGVARTFQNIRVFKDMTLRENVLVAMGEHSQYRAISVLLPLPHLRAAELSEHQTARRLLSRVGLADKAELIARTLSYGEQRRLELARALATEPKVLLLDEPAAGMNAVEKQQLMAEIVRLDQAGLSIVIIEHDMRFVMGLCRRIAVLNFGRVIAQGTPDEIRANPEVIEAYLGRENGTEFGPAAT
jgi:branched-chain amino acid transport system ATP-binding protein